LPAASESIAAINDSDNRRRWGFVQRHGLLLVGVSPVIANLIGSAFNIAYNHVQIQPLLSPAQLERFEACWQVFNVVVYPLAVFCWVLPLLWLRTTHRALLAGESVAPQRLEKAQRYVVNLPWWILAVAGVSWLICIPVFPAALHSVPEQLEMNVVWHLITSFVVASLIAVTQSFFAVELVSQKALFPVFFRTGNPADVPGALPLSLTARGMMWAVSAVISPVVSLVLLLLMPEASRATPMFGVAVGVVAIAFGMSTAWMLGKLVADPVRKLKRASMRVAEGNFDTRVNLMRADDFGPLIERFNLMVEGLKEKAHLQETFGCHVGHEAARLILQQGDGLVGSEQVVTVMFVDVRNFTEHSSRHTPQEVVEALNLFFSHAVELVEAQGGMVNKFLGDGFMALFGIGPNSDNHALRAIEAGRALLECLRGMCEQLQLAGWPDFQIGIGVNSGPAIVGSIGSPKRQEYTAIGDTVNVASRVEALTKTVGQMFLVTDATRRLLPQSVRLKALPPQAVKGKGQPLEIFAVQ
jgi:adenylate cyclase